MSVGLGAILLLASQTARGQQAAPVVPDIEKRSGLLTRSTSILPHLPPDPKRDNFYDTRYGHYPTKICRNNMLDGGLYGERWKGDATATVPPYFWGTASNSVGPQHKNPFPMSRWLGNFIHPFRPVGMYYDRGAYVPIYDLDPFVPGPGPFPWRFYIWQPLGG
jgi:hypothetical protein